MNQEFLRRIWVGTPDELIHVRSELRQVPGVRSQLSQSRNGDLRIDTLIPVDFGNEREIARWEGV